MKRFLFLIVLLAAGYAATAQAGGDTAKKKCLYISSYHQGYAWSDGVERGLRATLGDQCEIKQFDMDTKRNQEEAFQAEQAKKAKDLIESWEPDVVITSDDIVAKALIVPFYKDADVPIVFCGINWSVEEYGFPFTNVTGIVEISPVKEMLEKAKGISGGNRAIYIGADTVTEAKNLARFEDGAPMVGVVLDKLLVTTTDEWLKGFVEAQSKYDFIVIGSKAGINDWDEDKVKTQVENSTKILSVTNHSWMMPFAVYGMAKVPKEHGQKAGEYALKILAGADVASLPIITNNQWEIWINEPLMKAGNINVGDLPEENVFAVGGGELMLNKQGAGGENTVWVLIGVLSLLLIGVFVVRSKST